MNLTQADHLREEEKEPEAEYFTGKVTEATETAIMKIALEQLWEHLRCLKIQRIGQENCCKSRIRNRGRSGFTAAKVFLAFCYLRREKLFLHFAVLHQWSNYCFTCEKQNSLKQEEPLNPHFVSSEV